MKSRIVLGFVAALIVVAAFPLGGCEDTDLTAPTDGSLVLTANPTALNIDPQTEAAPSCQEVWRLRPDLTPDQKQAPANRCVWSLIDTRVYTKAGAAASNIAVTFSATSGWFGDANRFGNPTGVPSRVRVIRTDAQGSARVTLTVFEGDPTGPLEVAAQSSSLRETVSLAVTTGDENQPPRATFVAVPRDQQAVGQPVTFDGSGSVDPDGDTITCYRWLFLSDNPDDPTKGNPEVVQGSVVSGIDRIFQNEQNLSVTLQVSDRVEAAPLCVEGQQVPDAYFSPNQFRDQYAIICANTKPVANAGPDQTQLGSPGQQVSVILDGRNSSDADGQIVRYVWNCGNGTFPQPLQQGDDRVVICRYFPGTYQAQLTVWDNGTGEIQNGNYVCQQSSSDTTNVTVNVPQ